MEHFKNKLVPRYSNILSLTRHSDNLFLHYVPYNVALIKQAYYLDQHLTSGHQLHSLPESERKISKPSDESKVK
jgi:hypothetical protein